MLHYLTMGAPDVFPQNSWLFLWGGGGGVFLLLLGDSDRCCVEDLLFVNKFGKRGLCMHALVQSSVKMVPSVPKKSLHRRYK